MINNQKQQAGDYSTQILAQNLTIGIDEKRAREIYEEKYQIAKLQFTQEAMAIANSRIQEFENKLIDKMQKVEGAIESFCDPSVQLLLIEAQKSAAQSERIADYDLLSELLVHRHLNKSNRETVAGINRAVKVVNEISDDALQSLTIVHLLDKLVPASGDIHTGLQVFDTLFSQIMHIDLPEKNNWIEHLDLLGAVRVVPFNSGLNPLKEVFKLRFNGYICSGIEKDSESYRLAIETLTKNNIPLDILVEHILNPNYVRLNIVNQEAIENITLNFQTQFLPQVIPLNHAQKDALNQIFQMSLKNEDLLNQINEKFIFLWNRKKFLNRIYEWWPKVTVSFNFTSVGIVLAHANAQRCEKSIPNL